MTEVFYDIYRQMEESKVRWIVRVQGLEQAHERVDYLEISHPGQYLIYDFRQRAIVPHIAVPHLSQVAAD